MIDKELATAIKQLREKRDLTQEDVAFAAGITESALSRIERGLNDPGWKTVRRIVDALDIDMIDLVTLVEELETT